MTPEIEREHVQAFSSRISACIGLQHDDSKFEFLSSILRQRVLELGLGSARVYLEMVSRDIDCNREMRILASRLTVAETYFFRNRDQFRALREAVVPHWINARSGQERRLRILSAGCATGEEAYSIAILLQELLPERSDWLIDIVAVDVTPEVLERAARAQYSAWALRDTDDAVKAKYFRTHGSTYHLTDAIRKLVRFEERNLAADEAAFWQPGAFDIIFCRNVIMYFSPDVARNVVRRVHQALVPGGHLFLGHAETLRGLSADFHLCHTHGTFYYQKRAPQMDRAPHELPASAICEVRPQSLQPVAMNADWADAIQRASDKIANLALSQSALPSTPQAATGTHARSQLEAAFNLMREERFSDALASLERLPAETRGDPKTLLLHASLHVNANRFEAAEALCFALLQQDEMNAGAHYLLALCSEHGGALDKAANHDYMAIYLDPTFAMPHLHLGLMARRAGNGLLAAQRMATAIQLLLSEGASRILLFGGGFTREALVALCRSEVQPAGEAHG